MRWGGGRGATEGGLEMDGFGKEKARGGLWRGSSYHCHHRVGLQGDGGGGLTMASLSECIELMMTTSGQLDGRFSSKATGLGRYPGTDVQQGITYMCMR